MKKVLVIGGTGLIGSYLLRKTPADYQAVGTWHTRDVAETVPAYHVDMTSAGALASVFAVYRPDIVIHCAGLNDVDACERQPSLAREINVDPLVEIVRQCVIYHSKLVYFSTNAVFDGEHAPYMEGSIRNPVNTYGIVKKEAEDYIMRAVRDWIPCLIIRTMLVYGYPLDGGRTNWFTRVVFAALEGKPLHLVDDTQTQPTFAGALADAVWTLLDKDVNGTIHIAGGDKVSIFEFAGIITRSLGRDEAEHIPVPSTHFPMIARRPTNTVFYLGKLKHLGIEPVGIIEGLRRLYDELQTERNDIHQERESWLLPVRVDGIVASTGG